jgi:hypothetical protein
MSGTYLSSGELARLVGLSRESIRRYEAVGIIPKGRRDPFNGRRYWSEEEAEGILRLLRPAAAVPEPARVRVAALPGRRDADDWRADGADGDER